MPRSRSSPTLSLSRGLLHPGERVCAAVSGGADSIAMLLLLYEQNGLERNALGVVLSAVHVHHGLRGPEADADLAFVQALCSRLAVPLQVEHTSVPERLARTRQQGRPETLEEAARAERYGVFARLLAAGSADSVLTAHTLDDQAETVLLKLLRGAWTEGLSGIHPVVAPPPGAPVSARGRIVRPLLHLRRSALREFLEAHGQPWREDSSNADPAHARNRVRNHLLPLLRGENPAVDTGLAHIATLAREEEARWSAELARLLPQVLLPGTPVRGGGRASGPVVGIELERLRPMDSALRRRVVRAAARSLGVRLSFDETAAVLLVAGFAPAHDVTAAQNQPRRLHIGGALLAERSARELRLSRFA